MTEEFDDSLLRAKEERFKEFVKLASKIYKLQFVPKIVFHDGYLPDGPDVLAHIYLDSGQICVSRIRLKEMPIEKVKETAFHEVTHLLNASHDTFFHNKLDDVMLATWKPESTSGLLTIDGGRRIEKPVEKNKKESKIDKVRCNYHLCRKKTKLKRCPHCREYFCKEHFKPIPPSMPNFDYPNKFAEWKHEEHYHPCPAYYDYLVKKEKEKRRKIEESLNKMNRFGVSYDTKFETEASTEPELEVILKEERKIEKKADEQIRKYGEEIKQSKTIKEEKKTAEEKDRIDDEIKDDDQLNKVDELGYVSCDKCGRKTPEQEIKRTYYTGTEGGVSLCPSCYFGGTTISEPEEKKKLSFFAKLRRRKKKK